MKVLANDGLEISAINEIKKNGISIETNHLDKEALIENIKDYDVLVVRSATKVTSEVLEAGAKGNLKLVIRAGVGIDNINLDYGNLEQIAHYESINGDDEDEDEKFDGALVADPELNTETGAKMQNGRSKYIRDNVVDFDFSSLYPSITIGFNINPATMVGKLFIIDNKVVDRYSAPEISKDKYDAAKDFMEGVLTQNYLMVGTRWFNLPTTDVIFKQFEEYFGINNVNYIYVNDDDINAYNVISDVIEINLS